jgi:hypothetical protein
VGVTLGQLQSRLIGELDVIPASSARERINEAVREIYDENDWGFLYEDSFIRTPALIEGQANVTKFSPIVTVDDNIAAAINNTDPMDVDLFEKQFRSLSAVEVDRGFVYKIVNWIPLTNSLIIDPPFQDVNNLSAKVQILKMYYRPPEYIPPYVQGIEQAPAPVIDFKRFEYIFTPQWQRRLILNATQNELYKFDPYREIVSEPRYVIPYRINELGEPIFEIYPAPKFSRVLRVKYLRAGLPLSRDEHSLNDVITKELVISKAKGKSYLWAKANADKLNFKAVGRYGGFDNLIVFAEKEYQTRLEECKRRDEERYPKAYQGNFINFPYYESDFGNYGLDDGVCETLVLSF